MPEIRLKITDDSQVQLVCPDGRIAVWEGGAAICPKCGAYAERDELAGRLFRCRESVERLIESVGELVGR